MVGKHKQLGSYLHTCADRPIMFMKPGQPCVDPGFLFDQPEDWIGFIRARKHEDWPAFQDCPENFGTGLDYFLSTEIAG